MRRTAVAWALVSLLATPVFAVAGDVPTQHQVLNDITESVNQYVYYTIFDDVSASVEGGVVTLTGKVTMGYKRNAIAERVAAVPGVSEVRNEIGFLPVSLLDDALRYRIARNIYRDVRFRQYHAINAPVHIVVEHGRVTLKGTVHDNVERMQARSLAIATGALTVTNELLTEAEARAARETVI